MVVDRARRGSRGGGGPLGGASTRTLARLLVLLVVVLVPPWRSPSALAFQDELEGKIVRSVDIFGNRRISEGAVRVSVKTRVGEPLSRLLLDEDVKNLYALGFSRVEVFAEPSGDGVAIRFNLEENPRIRSVRYEGADHFDREELDSITNLRAGQFASDLILKLAVRDLERRYRADGYEYAEAKILRKGTPEGIRIRVRVIEGPRVKVKDVRIVGNRHLSGSQIRSVMQTSRTLPLRNEYLNRETLDQDVVAIKSLYREEGFRDVEVELADVWTNQDKDRATVTIAIREGERYRVREIRIEGNELFSDAEILDAMVLKAGEPFVSRKLDYDVFQGIPRLYGRKAYIRARAVPKVTYAEREPTADIVIQISEGKKVYMGELKIEGNVLTRDKVIRREISIAPGDPVNLDEMIRSRDRLIDSGYFEMENGVTFEPSGPQDLDSEIQDYVWRVREGQTGFVRFSIGVGSNSGVIGDITFTKRNFDITKPPGSFEDLLSGEAFTGAGQTLFITFAPGTQYSRYQIGFREPFLFDTKNSFGIDLYQRVRLWSAYDETRLGVRTRVGRYLSRFDPDLAADLELRLEQVDLDNLDIDAPQDAYDWEGESNVVSLGPSIRYQALDRPAVPTRGFRAELGYEFAGGPLGGDVNYNKVVLETRGFVPLLEDRLGRRHVLSAWTQFGWMEEFGDVTSTPIFDRFYAGGRESIRGFEFRGVGPHQEGEPVGGNILMVGGIEYEFPLIEDVLRGVTFVDAGTVAPSVHDDDFRKIRLAVGFGLRLRIPFFGPVPFALDFGFPFLKGDEDDRQTFSFALGAPFFGTGF